MTRDELRALLDEVVDGISEVVGLKAETPASDALALMASVVLARFDDPGTPVAEAIDGDDRAFVTAARLRRTRSQWR